MTAGQLLQLLMVWLHNQLPNFSFWQCQDGQPSAMLVFPKDGACLFGMCRLLSEAEAAVQQMRLQEAFCHYCMADRVMTVSCVS
jgi:hypothetical protein